MISVTQELAVAGKIEPKMECVLLSGDVSQTPKIYSNMTKNISDIFASVTTSDGLTKSPCIILIEGAPGIGKTVIAKEIAFQWANNKILTDKKILMLLFLRQCNFRNITSVESFIQYVIKSSQMTTGLAKYLLLTEGKDLVVVFDGYDEISEEDRKSSIVADMIDRRIFAKSCLVITSRPTTSSTLHSFVDCRVEIVGFTEEDRLDYIQNVLQGNDDKVAALTLYLQSNPTINALCYIPLNMTILLCLVEDGIDKLPKTQTELYKKFIEMTILRFIQKIDSKVITNVAKLPFPHNKVFEELAKLAYKGLKFDKIVFSLDEIEELCPNLAMTSSNWNGLGLLKAVKYFNTEFGNVTFHFLHFSIQEYLAAWYISTIKHKKQIKLLKETFWLHHYYNTWIMYVGITHGSSFALKHFLSGNWFQFTTKIFKTSSVSYRYLKHKIKCLHLFQCLVESNNEGTVALVNKSFQGNQIDLSSQTLLPHDVNVLGFFLIRSLNKQWEMLNLSRCNIGSIGSNILCDRFLNKENCHIVIIKRVDFSYNQLNFSSLTQLFNLFKSWHTSELIIKDNGMFQSKVGNDMYEAIEDSFISSGYDIQANLQIGSFLFACGINKFPILLNAVSIKSIHLLNCKWTPPVPGMIITKCVEQLELNKVHLIDTSLPDHLMKVICFRLSRYNNALVTKNLFVYNYALSDRNADEISSLISKGRMLYAIMLIISKSKIQGLINTNSLSNELSKLEILNLILNVRLMCFNHIWTYPWRRNLCCNGDINDLIMHTFIDSLHKIACSNSKGQLRIALREKNV